MNRKLAALVSFVVAIITVSMWSAASAFADGYVPTPVVPTTGSTTAATTTVQTLPSSQSLSYTGTGFNVGGVIAIGVLVLLVGALLVFVGARMSRSRVGGHR